MKLQEERRKDPVSRYLWGKIFDLEEKIKRLEDHTNTFDKTLTEVKEKSGGEPS